MVEIAKRMRIFWFCIVYFSSLSFAVLAADPVKDGEEIEPVEIPMTLIVNPVVDGEEIDPIETFERAERAMGRADVNDALFLLRAAAMENYTPAQVRLGEFFDYSDFKEDAVGWFLVSAFQGNINGAYGLAKMYALGEGISQRDDKALFWYRFAAERNHLMSVKMLVLAYEEGHLGVEKDADEAKFWEDKLPRLLAIQKEERRLSEERYAKDLEDAHDAAEAAAEERSVKIRESKETEETKSEKDPVNEPVNE